MYVLYANFKLFEYHFYQTTAILVTFEMCKMVLTLF
jgi:hypothetical protein